MGKLPLVNSNSVHHTNMQDHTTYWCMWTTKPCIWIFIDYFLQRNWHARFML